MATAPSSFFFPTTAPIYAPTAVFPPPPLGFGSPRHCYPPPSSYAVAYHYPHPAAAYPAPPPGFFPGPPNLVSFPTSCYHPPLPNSPNWPPPAPESTSPPATGAQATHPPPDPPAALPSAAPPIFSSTTTYSPPNFPVESGKNFYPAAPTTPDREYRPPQHHASTPTSITRASSSTFPSVATYHYKPESVAPTTPEPATTGAPATPAMPATDSTSSQHSSVDFVLGPPPSSSPAAAKVDSALLELHHPDAPSSTGDLKTDAYKRHATAAAFPTSTATPTTPSALLFPGTPLSTELAKLTAMASQLSDSIGKLAASQHTRTPAVSAPAPARVVSQVFDDMPTPSSGNGTGSTTTVSTTSLLLSSGPSVFSVSASNVPSTTTDIAPQVFGEMHKPRPSPRKYGSPLHYYLEQEDSIQSTCVPDKLSNFKEQNLDGMLQSYGFGNLHRRSILLADGIEQSYYALPEDYPLEHATPSMSPSAAHNIGVTAQLPVPAQAADVSSKLPKEMHVHTVSEEEHQEIEQLPKYYSESSKNPLPEAVSEFTLADNVDVSVATYKQRQCIPQLLEYAYTPGCAMGDVLLIDYKWNMVLSEEGREVWDPGASTPPYSSKFGAYVQQPRDPSWNVVLLPERRKEWDPGVPIILPSYPATPPTVTHPGASTSVYSSQATPPRGLSYVEIGFPDALNWCNQVGTHVLNVLVIHEKRNEWDPGDTKLHDLFMTATGATKLQCSDDFPKMLKQLLCAATTEQEPEQRHHWEFSLMIEMLPNGSELDGQLTYMHKGNYLCSLYCNSGLKTEYCKLRCLWEFSTDLAKRLQWDPGVHVLLYSYIATHPIATPPGVALWLIHFQPP